MHPRFRLDAVATRFSHKYPSFAGDVNVINRGAPYTGFVCVKITPGPGEPGRAEAVDCLLSESRRILKPSLGPTSQLPPHLKLVSHVCPNLLQTQHWCYYPCRRSRYVWPYHAYSASSANVHL